MWYGVLAEIGAGQEVASWFFRVGAAAGTIAKSISAYDMTISDSVYGKADRQAVAIVLLFTAPPAPGTLHYAHVHVSLCLLEFGCARSALGMQLLTMHAACAGM